MTVQKITRNSIAFMLIAFWRMRPVFYYFPCITIWYNMYQITRDGYYSYLQMEKHFIVTGIRMKLIKVRAATSRYETRLIDMSSDTA